MKGHRMKDLSHDDLAHNLAQHLDIDGRMVWENLPAGCMGSVRPDVYTLEKSFSNPNPITYEVKVSLSDFRSDVTKAKWKSYLDFSYGVTFAVPKGLVTKKDIPSGCGLITYNGSGIWRTVKKPTLHVRPIPSDLLLKLLMSGEERRTKHKPIQPRNYDKWKHLEKINKKFGKDIAQKIAQIEKYPKMMSELRDLKKQISDILGTDPDKWGFVQNSKYKIECIEKMADESGRKALIADELKKLENSISSSLSKITTKYT